jgi:hypothetical protein
MIAKHRNCHRLHWPEYNIKRPYFSIINLCFPLNIHNKIECPPPLTHTESQVAIHPMCIPPRVLSITGCLLQVKNG